MTLLRSSDLYDTSPARGWIPWGALAPLLALTFVILSQLAGIPLIEPFVSLDPLGNPRDPLALLAYTLVPFALLATIVLVWVRFIERRPFAAIGLRGAGAPRAFAWGHAVGMLSIVGIVTLIALSGGLHPTGGPTAWSAPASLGVVGLLLIGFAIQSSVEELLFRGWLLSVLTRKFNVIGGVVLSSLLFALLHFTRGEPWLVNVCDFAFGVFACAWALRYRSIVGVMGWHAGWNWLLAVGFGLPVTGIDVGTPALLLDLKLQGPAWLSGGAEGPEGSVFCLAYCVLAIVWLRRWPMRSAPNY
jgi:membrane protease YdiL (CAAX protease family)